MKRVSARASRRRASVYLHTRAAARTASRALALLLASALLNLTAAHAAGADAAPNTSRAYAGELTIVGDVNVDGSPAASGQTVFPGSAVAALEKSRALVNLGPLGRLELSPRTSLSLDFGGAGAAYALESGRVRVSAPDGSAASVKTAEAAVSSAGGSSAVFSVESIGGVTSVAVQSGQAEVRAGGGLHLVKAGESFTTAPKPEPRKMSDDKRKGLYVLVAAAVAAVAIVLAARGSNDVEDSFGGCIDVISGESHCF
ncbi:MAG TPA: FecR domain-containing protein [Pyrinomonadaceae bacterium]|nr:FecR domain-containing protein [Pyrinomonadaceae bacterium]